MAPSLNLCPGEPSANRLLAPGVGVLCPRRGRPWAGGGRPSWAPELSLTCRVTTRVPGSTGAGVPPVAGGSACTLHGQLPSRLDSDPLESAETAPALAGSK